MSNLQVKNVPEGLHAELRRRAAHRGLTVRDYVLQLIELDQRLPATEDWIEDLRTHRPVDVSAEQVVRALDDGRNERDRDVIGPLAR